MFFLFICLIRFAAKGRSTNEADAILNVATSSGFREVSPFFISMKELPHIIDKTRKRIQARAGYFLVIRNSKLGLGSAYRDGFLWGVNKKFSFMIQMDADFSHTFNDLDNILNESKTSDVVIGSRYVEGGGSEGWDFKRKLLSKSANLVSRIVLQSRINDMTSGFRSYSANTLDKIKFQNTKSEGYSFQIEMTMRCEISTLEIKEIPIIFNERRVGNSKMSKKIIIEALLFLAKNGIRRWLNLKIK